MQLSLLLTFRLQSSLRAMSNLTIPLEEHHGHHFFWATISRGVRMWLWRRRATDWWSAQAILDQPLAFKFALNTTCLLTSFVRSVALYSQTVLIWTSNLYLSAAIRFLDVAKAALWKVGSSSFDDYSKLQSAAGSIQPIYLHVKQSSSLFDCLLWREESLIKLIYNY